MSNRDDGDDPNEYSPGARALSDSIGVRKHYVDLERVQRIHLDLDDEPMEFSAETIAAMVQDVADNCNEHEAFILHAVANALSGKDEHHVLLLQQNKRGRFVSPHEHRVTHIRNQHWLHWLAAMENDGVKTESAITEIARRFGVSRATVFSGIRQAEKFLETGRSIFPQNGNFENPRPSKTGNG